RMIEILGMCLGVVDVALGIVAPLVEAVGRRQHLAHETASAGCERARTIERGPTGGGHALEFRARQSGELRRAGVWAPGGAYRPDIALKVEATASPMTRWSAMLKASTTAGTEFWVAGASADAVCSPTICFSGSLTSLNAMRTRTVGASVPE